MLVMQRLNFLLQIKYIKPLKLKDRTEPLNNDLNAYLHFYRKLELLMVLTWYKHNSETSLVLNSTD